MAAKVSILLKSNVFFIISCRNESQLKNGKVLFSVKRVKEHATYTQ